MSLPRSPLRSVTPKHSFSSFKPLRHHTSKLDLIDDTTLTSLPLPPPPKRAKRAKRSSTIDNASETSSSPFNPFNPPNPNTSSLNPSSLNFNHSDLGTRDQDTSMCTEGDETFDESHDPIVLVEDYVAEVVSGPPSQAKLLRQKSIAHMKTRLHRPPSETSASSSGPENLEDIFGKIPGSDQLKHCTLCSKPLYEISSIITSASARGGSRDCDEFVCWECITLYEQIVSDLDGGQLEFAEESQPNSPRKLAGRQTSQTHVEIEPKKRKTFSDGLIHRFHELNRRTKASTGNGSGTGTTAISIGSQNGSGIGSGTGFQSGIHTGDRHPQWLLNLQERLRWS